MRSGLKAVNYDWYSLIHKHEFYLLIDRSNIYGHGLAIAQKHLPMDWVRFEYDFIQWRAKQ